MRLLIVDTELAGLDFALRCSDAGHDVKLWHDPTSKVGRGFRGVKIVPSWRDEMAWARSGLVLPTGNSSLCASLASYSDAGWRVFGPSPASARLEIDREHGMRAMEAAGIDVPEYRVCASLQEAKKCCQENGEMLVFKPLGSEEDKSLTYVAGNQEEFLGWIDNRIKNGRRLKGKCLIQKKIDMVSEMGVSGWVGPVGFLEEKWQICFEHKKLMNGEIGPNTGEQGTVCQYSDREKMAEEMLLPMEHLLRTCRHVGDFAVGCGIDSRGKAWPFEFTCRLGWPAFYIQCASHVGDPLQWMFDIFDGKDTLRVSRDVSIGVVMSQPPYPKYTENEDNVGNKILGANKVKRDFHPVYAMGGWDDMETAGPLVGVVTSRGKTIAKAKNKVYSAVEEIKFPNAMYRTDIGDKVISSVSFLHKNGFAEELN